MPSTAPESSYTVSAPFALEAVEVLLHRALSAIAEENPDRDCGAWLDDSIYVVLDENLPRLDVSDAQPLLAFMAAARFGVRIALATVNNPLADTSAALGECIDALKKGIFAAAASATHYTVRRLPTAPQE